MRFQCSFALLALAAPALGDSNNSHPRPPTKTSPCAIVSASWAAQISATPAGKSFLGTRFAEVPLTLLIAVPTVAASLAHDCLNSVPLGASEAMDLMEAIGPYLEFQSGVSPLNCVGWSLFSFYIRQRNPEGPTIYLLLPSF
jgi:hypothetical protein